MQQMQSATNEWDALAVASQLLEVAPLVMRSIRALMRAQSGTDVTVPQFRALGYVGRHPDCSVSAVAEHLGLSVPAASRLVDGLVENGLVERLMSATDRRYVALHLAPKGQRIREAAQHAALMALTELLTPLGASEREAIGQGMLALRAVFSEQGISHIPERNL
jgi:DNA-binding MarR family transcriptional regulator